MQGYADQHGIGTYAIAAKPVAANSYASVARHAGGMSDVGGTGLVAEARRYVGTNPTGRSRLWCGHFMNMVLERSGHRSSGSNMARSFASYGTRISGPQVGAIAVMSRGKRGGHVGVVSGIDANGNVTVISGNHGRRVAEFDLFSWAHLRLRDAVTPEYCARGSAAGQPAADCVWNDPSRAAFARRG